MLAVLVAGAWAQEAPALTWKPIVEVRQRVAVGAVGDAAAVARGVEQRARLGMEVQRLGVSARVSFQEVRTWVGASGTVTPRGFSPTIAEGWARVEGDLTRNVGAVATVGRQAITVHEGRIVGADDFVPGGQFLDALRIVGRAAPVSVEYVNARRFDNEDEDPLGLGVNLLRFGAAVENPVTAWVADAIWVVDARATDETTSTAGAYVRLDSGRWRGRAEGYLQGSGDGTATLLGLSAGWVFGPNERLVAHLRYDGFSGDDELPDGGRAPWRRVLGDTHRFNGLLDRFDDPEVTDGRGLADLQLVVESRPAPQLSTGLAVHRFWSPIDGGSYGVELDASAGWSFSPFARFRGGGAWFVPDETFPDSRRLFGYVELDATF